MKRKTGTRRRKGEGRRRREGRGQEGRREERRRRQGQEGRRQEEGRQEAPQEEGLLLRVRPLHQGAERTRRLRGAAGQGFLGLCVAGRQPRRLRPQLQPLLHG